jgi:hypothetical protein
VVFDGPEYGKQNQMKLEDYVKKFGGKVDEKTLKIIEERMKRRREKERMRKPQARSSSA